MQSLILPTLSSPLQAVCNYNIFAIANCVILEDQGALICFLLINEN